LNKRKCPLWKKKKSEGAMIFVEPQWGATSESLSYLRKVLSRLKTFEAIRVTITGHGAYTFEVYGLIRGEYSARPVIILLGGCNCGYGGTGPHGSVEALRLLGIPCDDVVEQKIFSSQICAWHKHEGWRFWRSDEPIHYCTYPEEA